MKNIILWIISTLLSLTLAGTSLAQITQTPEEILKAWLSSPHADSKSQSFRHWDTEGEVPGTCAVCHSTTGVVDYLSKPQTTPGVIDHPVPVGTTIECAACHNDGAKNLVSALFPNGQSISSSDSSAICTVCHQGRTSMDQVNANVEKIGEDEVSPDIRFINIHYAAAASTQLGSIIRGGYQYEGRSYVGTFTHVEDFDTCVSCHDVHTTKVEIANCTNCHQGAADFKAIRTTPIDVLGDGNTTTGISVVIDRLHDRLLAAIMTYASEAGGGAIVYSKSAFPYFFNDLDGNGIVEEAEAVFPNSYKSWTPRLLKAAYNYQFVGKDVGAYAHNPHYVIQFMIDSIENLAEVAKIDTSNLNRP